MQLKVSQSTLFWDFMLCSEVNRPAGICVNCGHTPDEKNLYKKEIAGQILTSSWPEQSISEGLVSSNQHSFQIIL
jgi:hypothetical protein